MLKSMSDLKFTQRVRRKMNYYVTPLRPFHEEQVTVWRLWLCIALTWVGGSFGLSLLWTYPNVPWRLVGAFSLLVLGLVFSWRGRLTKDQRRGLVIVMMMTFLLSIRSSVPLINAYLSLPVMLGLLLVGTVLPARTFVVLAAMSSIFFLLRHSGWPQSPTFKYWVIDKVEATLAAISFAGMISLALGNRKYRLLAQGAAAQEPEAKASKPSVSTHKNLLAQYLGSAAFGEMVERFRGMESCLVSAEGKSPGQPSDHFQRQLENLTQLEGFIQLSVHELQSFEIHEKTRRMSMSSLVWQIVNRLRFKNHHLRISCDLNPKDDVMILGPEYYVIEVLCQWIVFSISQSTASTEPLRIELHIMQNGSQIGISVSALGVSPLNSKSRQKLDEKIQVVQMSMDALLRSGILHGRILSGVQGRLVEVFFPVEEVGLMEIG